MSLFMGQHIWYSHNDLMPNLESREEKTVWTIRFTIR
nr:MAG TPA: hypothetical protein [Caudoviricetes sp.]